MIRSIEMDYQKDHRKYIGIDIGSVSVKVVVMNNGKEVLENHYVRSHGQSIETVSIILKDILNRIPLDDVEAMAATGSGGKLLADIIDISFINEVVAQSTATMVFHPKVRTVIELGGEDSKLILLECSESADNNDSNRRSGLKVSDFAMNTMCAAGTGSFLDQQAARIGISIEDEFGKLALKSKNPPRIAGRCSVFAKSDMIHLQQVGTPIHDIAAGLCYALTRNFKSNIGKGKEFVKPIAFQGGVASNIGIVRAFEDILGLSEGELIIPKYFKSMGAIGSVLTLMDKGIYSPFKGFKKIDAYLGSRKGKKTNLRSLTGDNYAINVKPHKFIARKKIDAYVGVDVGSISTNVVVIDEDKNVLSRRYLMTAGKPLEAVRQGLFEVGEEVGNKVIVNGVGVTGSGRYLTGEFIGADIVKNEITAHATAAAVVDKEVDTIFEIGGQDSKYISMENGAIVDFTMNKVCAAGTGSFLEEQSEKLNISIKKEFGKKALDSCCPSQLGERCTVFMESDLNHHQQIGVPKDDLLAGLSYSIVLNYINRVVEKRRIGDVIFLQGGVAANRGVKAAFEKVTGKRIIVPPHHDIMGAIGSAIIAMEEREWDSSRFKGFDLMGRKYEMSSFVCKDCSNICEIRKVSISGESPLHYGSRCGKFDDEKKAKRTDHLPRLFNERKKYLHTYSKGKPRKSSGKLAHLTNSFPPEQVFRAGGRIGIPQASTFFELFPMWNAFFTELGLDVITSKDTNANIINSGLETVNTETCFPIKVAHGHVVDMLDKDIDYLFIPSVVNMTQSTAKVSHSYACPYVQCLPYVIRSAIDLDNRKFKLLQPVIHFEYGETYLDKTLRQIARDVGRRGKVVDRAIIKAKDSQKKFYRKLENRGKDVLDKLGDDDIAFVIISRPYNGCDSGVNLDLPDKLRDLGVLAIPMDFLTLDIDEISKDYPNMYWKYGQKILAAARVIAKDKRLHALYITNFGCGPDSFISKFFPSEVGGKPYLTIEIDEHSGDSGVITRCEAFLDSLKNARVKEFKNGICENNRLLLKKEKTMYIPYINDCGRMAAAAMRVNGINAEAMPMADKKSLELGRKYTSGKECYPAIITTGDIVKKAISPDFDPENSMFLMASASGPCRFGQYNKMHRMVLNDLGLHNVQLYSIDQTVNFNEYVTRLGTNFRKLTWKGIVLVDYLQKLLLETRPFETNNGESDTLYRQCLRKAEHAIERYIDLRRIAKEACEAFARVEVDKSIPKPVIGVVGEQFTRGNEFCNNYLFRKLEELGCVVVTPTFGEWINYITYCRRKEFQRVKNIIAVGKELISEIWQGHEAHKISSPFKGYIKHFFEEISIKKIIAKGKAYIDDSYKGEPILTMGKAVEFYENDADGIINILPFSCMPGNIVNALLEKFQKVCNGIPCIKLAFDGQEQTNEETRIEAFVHQSCQRMERRLETVG
ncbi:MAG: putative CoA enzyme activase [Candidatus Scalindua rubra]|uniref:Putative CoA enzyme activase n=1 Tax=Candidatus Scalindua rubra TaxID=1872076 RepID=A0A1E3XDB1_9BACT|nr:MAG: putative CoA enzyme activase [Candidatus Scalindua rubra]